MWFYDLYFLGNYDIALAQAKADTSVFRSVYIGIALDIMGDSDAARSYHEKSIKVFEGLSESTGIYLYQMMVSYSYAALNQKEEAIRWGKIALETMPRSKDSFAGATNLEYYSRVFILIGEYDEAIERLEFLLSIPSSVTPVGLKFNKLYDPLREHPRFIKLIAN